MRVSLHNQATCLPSLGWLADLSMRPQALARAYRVLREAKFIRVNHVRAMGKGCLTAW